MTAVALDTRRPGDDSTDRADRAVRTGAFLFTDVVGFTSYTATFGDEKAARLVDGLEQLTRRLLPTGGRIVKTLGDGLLCWCDESLHALDLARALHAQFGDPPLHSAVHYGDAIARGDDLVGHDVNVTARLVELAAPGAVLCSDAAWRRAWLDRPALRGYRMGPARVKGVPKPLDVWALRA